MTSLTPNSGIPKINTKGAEMLKKLYFWEEDRLKSFKKWPFDDHSKCNIKKMAEAGFYWCGNEHDQDAVACFVCDKHLDGWEEQDDPWEEHFSHAPQCLFAKIRKPQNELLIADIMLIIETTIKSTLERDFDVHKKKVNAFIDEQRKEIIKKFSR